MKRVYQAVDVPEAYIVLHIFEEARIEARVFQENLVGGLGELHSVYPEVWVMRDQDENKALALIQEYEQASAVSSRRRLCPACGEDNPANFELCWQCSDDLG